MLRTEVAFIAVLCALAVGGCSEKKPGAGPAANTASPSTAATDANAPLYPDWAQAVVPPYPNATIGFLVNTGLYQFQSTDDLATVAGWYKSHVNASWKTDLTTGASSATVNNVQIAIYRNSLTTGDAAKIKTMIELHYR